MKKVIISGVLIIGLVVQSMIVFADDQKGGNITFNPFTSFIKVFNKVKSSKMTEMMRHSSKQASNKKQPENTGASMMDMHKSGTNGSDMLSMMEKMHGQGDKLLEECKKNIDNMDEMKKMMEGKHKEEMSKAMKGIKGMDKMMSNHKQCNSNQAEGSEHSHNH